MRYILIVAFFLLGFDSALAVTNYRKAKDLADQIYLPGIARDIYCGCKFDKKGNVDLSSCSYNPMFAPRGKRIEWEHVVPAYFFYKNLECSRRGGRKTCRRTSPAFRGFEGDLHNIRPSVGELNAVRSNKMYGVVYPKEKKFGQCEFYSNKYVTEPPDNVKGDVARISLYMNDKYHLNFTKRFVELMKHWSLIDPVTPEEKALNMKIMQLQGDSNPYVGF